LTAGEILNKWPEAEVARILRDYGEERRWRHLAHKIVEQRLAGGIHTTAELVELIGGSTFGITSNPQLMACFISEFFFLITGCPLSSW
jgi:16S rRNA (cytosine1402-N4)-methyltransferase